MALVVETGTGSAAAESYASVAEADAYHAARGAVAWAALTTAAKEEALRRATDFLLGAYRRRWRGARMTDAQALDWPRYGVQLDDKAAPVATNLVPPEVKAACSALALTASTEALAPNLERTQAKVKVGPLEVEYDPAAPAYTRHRAVEMLLAPFLTGSAVMAKLTRA